MKRSRYQMINRGRKGCPNWYVEDFENTGGSHVGKYMYSSHSKSMAESFLKMLRSKEQTEITE